MKITVSKEQKIGIADPMIYGHFLEHHHRQVYGGVYDPSSRFADEDGFRRDVLEALKEIRTPIIRWPGGCFVSSYHWKYGVGKERTSVFDKSWRVEDPNTFGTDEFIRLCRKIGCEPYICTNAGTGTAEEMSDWVEYCNLENEGMWAKKRIEGGNPEPYHVRYWSVGNENYGGWEIGMKKSAEWGDLVRESCKMMLRVDPSIDLSAAAIPSIDWNMNLLREAGSYMNWISIHGYYDSTGDGSHPTPYSQIILKTGNAISDSINQVRAYLTAFNLEKRVRIAFDEWNLRFWYHPNIHNNLRYAVSKDEYLTPRDLNDINSIYTMADAVFTASFLNICLRNCDIVGMACFSPVVNTRGCICTHKDGIVLRPTFYVFKLFANLMKDTILNVWQSDVPQCTGIDGGCERTVDLVDAVVSYGEGAYAVSAVNKDAENAQELALSFLDDTVTEMRIHTLNGPSCDSYNDIDRNDVGITTSDWMPFDGKITLPAHSVSVIEIR